MSKSVEITFFTHGVTIDNEKGLAAGWHDAKLSPKGCEQALQIKVSLTGYPFQAVFSSDLSRALDYARIVFADSPIISDARLRECNYGDLTRCKKEIIDSQILDHIEEAFSDGESLLDVEKRMRSFLKDLAKLHAGEKIAIVSHRFPQLALEVILNGKSWHQVLQEDWRLQDPPAWQLGWDYELKL